VRVSSADLSIVLRPEVAQQIADSLLQEAWASREKLKLSLPPRSAALDPTDVLDLQLDGRDYQMRITGLADGTGRSLEAQSILAEIYSGGRGPQRTTQAVPPPAFGPPVVAYLDLPLLRGEEPPAAPYVAAARHLGPAASPSTPRVAGSTINWIVCSRGLRPWALRRRRSMQGRWDGGTRPTL
jgi:hypothetical protein